MNGKQKALASAAVGLLLAVAIIAASSVLPLAPPTTTTVTSPKATTTMTTTVASQTTVVSETTVTEEVTTTETITETRPPLGMGRLVLMVTDAPPLKGKVLKDLYVKIEDVVLHRANDTEPRVGFAATGGDAQGFYNLTALVDISEVVGVGDVPAGKYVKIVFNITEAKALFKDAETGALDSENTTLKVVANGKMMVPVHFDIEDGQTTQVTLDFDIERTQVNPNEVLRPVIVPKVHGSHGSQGSQGTESEAQAGSSEPQGGPPESPGGQGGQSGQGSPGEPGSSRGGGQGGESEEEEEEGQE